MKTNIAESLSAIAVAEGRTICEGLDEAFELSAEAVRLKIPATHLAAFVQGYLFARCGTGPNKENPKSHAELAARKPDHAPRSRRRARRRDL